MLLAPVLHQVPPGSEVVAYADNILVMTKVEGDSVAIESFGSAKVSDPYRNFIYT